MNRIRKHLTYANVVASICLFLLLGGGAAFAASQLGKNSVGTKQLKKNAVTQAKIAKNAVVGAKIKKEAITGAKVKKGSLTGTQINAATLGTVPTATNATNATNASVASSLTAPENVHLVGAPGEPGFEQGFHNATFLPGVSLLPVGFWKDKEGVVHMQGVAISESASLPFVFTLPPGFRPAAGALALYFNEEGTVLIGGSNVFLEGFDLSGKIVAEEEVADFEGITFRAGS